MTQEEKQLLLNDLCGRLPYGVIVDYKENEFEIPHWKITTIHPDTFDGWIGYDRRVGAGSESGSRPFKIGEVKPYLRPMSSMTEEEHDEIEEISHGWFYVNEDGEIFPVGQLTDSGEFEDAILPTLEWLDKKMFDYRGLIPMGLALEAPEDMYKTK